MSKSKLVALVVLGVVFFALGLYFNSVGMFDHMHEPPASWERAAEQTDRAENAKAEQRARDAREQADLARLRATQAAERQRGR
jgi:hypothetical protein